MEPVVELQNVSYSYHRPDREIRSLHHLSFSVLPGEFVAIVGPSGCGKSTLLSLICGLLQPEEGEVIIRARRTGFMPQKDHLLEWRSIFRNAILGPEMQHHNTLEVQEAVRNMLSAYGLDSFQNARPSELSGGMRQRAALIRTLALQPDLLLLDEPFSALDYQTRLEVSDDIGGILRREKRTAVLVTHDLSEAISLGNRVIVLSGRPARVIASVPIAFAHDKCTTEPLSPLARRNAPEFAGYFNHIWKELREHG
ncbi:MAG: ABC transporter ATP-binding protein [Lachnospiraceae bacterium]|uniref:ABC transporter ATP-binding protein n=1 Tax=Hominifimenecus microfluidus TaxID=2885348 RepID=A0AAE3E7Q8_9FIRM|nr:ABC transporter ATP-binding protein [Hominifimenecus microfluidus]MCC2229452.1 ABC transporter ATP-binding protein [Hominifimenecus microfluidus]